MRKFISAPLAVAGQGFLTPADGSRPPVPSAFLWDDRTLVITAVLRTWRSTKGDRGDNYLKRHWFELETACGLRLEVYYDREARRGATPWWIYTVAALKAK
ncbi:MAG: hypothetical protein JO190_10530 [Candidatus Eremiobacteraeota bacterium]|nr:hypothetical protein [Candidatus Eremiobacteraeota bacterium]MBV8498116.1 hypothetical protein [Candidatus Eremiobacteraeota bacterium]